MKLTYRQSATILAATKQAVAYLDAAAPLVREAVSVLQAAGVTEDDYPYDDKIGWEAMRLLQNAVAAELHTTDYFGS